MFGRRNNSTPAAKTPEKTTPKAVTLQPAQPSTNLPPSSEVHVPRQLKTQSGLRQAMSPTLKRLRIELLERIDASQVLGLQRAKLEQLIVQESASLANQMKLPLSSQDQNALAKAMLDDMLGMGPIQTLLDDDSISDILVNGYQQIYVERHGQLQLTDIEFFDEAHVRHIARRIAAEIGRRIDESHPMVDARLIDGSRVNIIIPPLSLNGTSISIRKFNQQGFDLNRLIEIGSVSSPMAEYLKIITQIRANILISGGTGAGKTSLLNAMSKNIHNKERIVTIEDAAELMLQQPHVVRLETRPASLEGSDQIDQQQLLINALRMRPDRIILGEVRAKEAFDMMQAMNTGHEGSMSSIHANTPTDALVRLENLLLMSQANMPLAAIRRQMVSALDVIIQINRMRDGRRRITRIIEISGMEGEQIQSQEMFRYQQSSEQSDVGEFYTNPTRSVLMEKAASYQLQTQLSQCFSEENNAY